MCISITFELFLVKFSLVVYRGKIRKKSYVTLQKPTDLTLVYRGTKLWFLQWNISTSTAQMISGTLRWWILITLGMARLFESITGILWNLAHTLFHHRINSARIRSEFLFAFLTADSQSSVPHTVSISWLIDSWLLPGSLSPISDNSFIHVTLQDALFLLLLLRIYYLSEKLSAKRQAICLSKYIAMCGLKYDWRGRSGLEPSAKLWISSILSFKVTLDPFSNTPRCPACLFRNVNVIITLFIWQNDAFFDGYLCRYTCH